MANNCSPIPTYRDGHRCLADAHDRPRRTRGAGDPDSGDSVALRLGRRGGGPAPVAPTSSAPAAMTSSSARRDPTGSSATPATTSSAAGTARTTSTAAGKTTPSTARATATPFSAIPGTMTYAVAPTPGGVHEILDGGSEADRLFGESGPDSLTCGADSLDEADGGNGMGKGAAERDLIVDVTRCDIRSTCPEGLPASRASFPDLLLVGVPPARDATPRPVAEGLRVVISVGLPLASVVGPVVDQPVSQHQGGAMRARLDLRQSAHPVPILADHHPPAFGRRRHDPPRPAPASPSRARRSR